LAFVQLLAVCAIDQRAVKLLFQPRRLPSCSANHFLFNSQYTRNMNGFDKR
jgi:hypothetical protein